MWGRARRAVVGARGGEINGPATRLLNIFDGPEAGLSKSASFVRLQQLLEGRNVVAQRVETQRLSLRWPSMGTLLLSIQAGR